MAVGIQYGVLVLLWWTMPALPRKQKDVTYFQILRRYVLEDASVVELCADDFFAASMAKFMVTKPLLIQACLLGFLSCGIFVSWCLCFSAAPISHPSRFFCSTLTQNLLHTGTTLTFLLADTPYGFDPFIIGLFGLCGIASICVAPMLGRMTDRLHPWTGSLLGLFLQLAVAIISVTTARLSLGGVIVVCIREPTLDSRCSPGRR